MTSHLTSTNDQYRVFSSEILAADVAEKVWEGVDKRPHLTPYQEKDDPESGLGSFDSFCNRARKYSCIKACCGDDCITVSNCSAYMPVLISVCEAVLGVTISETDLGNSHKIGAYTQGFILMPISPVSGFNSINEFIGERAIAWTLDLPDMKKYSGIKKQSDEMVNFSDKFMYVAQAADWVDKDWVTYDLHQLGKIISMITLDFRSGFAFPFIFKAEGGCGSFPPWMNVNTVLSSLFFYRRGKETSALMLAIHESTMIRKGQMAPADSEYLQLIHHSQNPGLWMNILVHFRELKAQGLSRLEIRDQIDMMLNKETIPQDLLENSVEVYPRSTLTGMMIAQMRSFGLLMTKIDVENHLARKKKFKLLTGNEPLGPAYEAEEQKLRDNRRKGNRLVLELTQVMSHDETKLALDREVAVEKSLSILCEYYNSHPGHYLSSFIYSDAVRIFKSSDVFDTVDNDERKLFLESLNLPSIPKREWIRTPLGESQVSAFDRANTFVQNLNLRDINDSNVELPFIGAADPLVLREVIRIHTGHLKEITAPTDYVYIIVTEDKLLISSIARYVKEKFNAHTLSISAKWMYDWCSRDPKLERLYRSNTSWRRDAQVLTSFSVRVFGKEKTLSSLDCEKILRLCHLEGTPNYVRVSFVFDSANVRRRLGLLSRHGMKQTISHSHSWLRRDRVKNLYGTRASLAFRPSEIPLDDLLQRQGEPDIHQYNRDDAIRVITPPLGGSILTPYERVHS